MAHAIALALDVGAVRCPKSLGALACTSRHLRTGIERAFAPWRTHAPADRTAMSQKEATEAFVLTPKDLRDLPANVVELGHGRVRHDLPIRGVIAIAIRKHATPAGLARARAARERRKGALARARAAKTDARDQRRGLLRAALAQRGLRLRDDSYICSKFIDDGEGEAEAIAIRMQEMAFFHAQPTYRRLREAHRDRLAEDVEWLPRPAWDALQVEAANLAQADLVRRFVQEGRAADLPPSLRG